MKRICVFDVNETLLDLAALDPHFEKAFGDAAVRPQWFMQMLQSAFVATITDSYVPFGEIGASALKMTAERQNVELSEGSPAFGKDDADSSELGSGRFVEWHDLHCRRKRINQSV